MKSDHTIQENLTIPLEIAVTLGVIFLLISTVNAQDLTPPPPMETTSVQNLINSIAELKQEIMILRQDNKELKIQLNKKLENQYNNMLIFIAFFTIGAFSLFNLLSRIYGWIMFKRLQRKTEKLYEEIITKYKLTHEEACQLYTKLTEIETQLNKVDSTIKEIIPKISKEQSTPIPKKRSFLSRFIFWKKPKPKQNNHNKIIKDIAIKNDKPN